MAQLLEDKVALVLGSIQLQLVKVVAENERLVEELEELKKTKMAEVKDNKVESIS